MGMRQPGPPQSPPSQPPGQSSPPEGGGDVSKLVGSIFSQLTQLMDALSQAAQTQEGVVNPDDIQELSSIIEAYQSFVKNTLGAPPGAKPKPAPSPGQVSPMQGSQPSSNVRQVGY